MMASDLWAWRKRRILHVLVIVVTGFAYPMDWSRVEYGLVKPAAAQDLKFRLAPFTANSSRAKFLQNEPSSPPEGWTGPEIEANLEKRGALLVGRASSHEGVPYICVFPALEYKEGGYLKHFPRDEKEDGKSAYRRLEIAKLDNRRNSIDSCARPKLNGLSFRIFLDLNTNVPVTPLIAVGEEAELWFQFGPLPVAEESNLAEVPVRLFARGIRDNEVLPQDTEIARFDPRAAGSASRWIRDPLEPEGAWRALVLSNRSNFEPGQPPSQGQSGHGADKDVAIKFQKTVPIVSNWFLEFPANGGTNNLLLNVIRKGKDFICAAPYLATKDGANRKYFKRKPVEYGPFFLSRAVESGVPRIVANSGCRTEDDVLIFEIGITGLEKLGLHLSDLSFEFRRINDRQNVKLHRFPLGFEFFILTNKGELIAAYRPYSENEISDGEWRIDSLKGNQSPNLTLQLKSAVTSGAGSAVAEQGVATRTPPRTEDATERKTLTAIGEERPQTDSNIERSNAKRLELIGRIQQDLLDMGYQKVGSVDRRWGQMTRSAITAFYRDIEKPESKELPDDIELNDLEAVASIIGSYRRDGHRKKPEVPSYPLTLRLEVALDSGIDADALKSVKVIASAVTSTQENSWLGFGQKIRRFSVTVTKSRPEIQVRLDDRNLTFHLKQTRNTVEVVRSQDGREIRLIPNPAKATGEPLAIGMTIHLRPLNNAERNLRIDFRSLIRWGQYTRPLNSCQARLEIQGLSNALQLNEVVRPTGAGAFYKKIQLPKELSPLTAFGLSFEGLQRGGRTDELCARLQGLGPTDKPMEWASLSDARRGLQMLNPDGLPLVLPAPGQLFVAVVNLTSADTFANKIIWRDFLSAAYKLYAHGYREGWWVQGILYTVTPNGELVDKAEDRTFSSILGTETTLRQTANELGGRKERGLVAGYDKILQDLVERFAVSPWNLVLFDDTTVDATCNVHAKLLNEVGFGEKGGRHAIIVQALPRDLGQPQKSRATASQLDAPTICNDEVSLKSGGDVYVYGFNQELALIEQNFRTVLSRIMEDYSCSQRTSKRRSGSICQ